jgi:hypothetical protein
MLSLDSENEDGDVRRILMSDHLMPALLKAIDLHLAWEREQLSASGQELDYREPHKTSEENFPFYDNNITLLAFLKRESFHAKTVEGKLKLLKMMKPGQGILAFWPLDYEKDAYLVDNIEQAIKVLETREGK